MNMNSIINMITRTLVHKGVKGAMSQGSKMMSQRGQRTSAVAKDELTEREEALARRERELALEQRERELAAREAEMRDR